MSEQPNKMWSGRFRDPLNRTFEQWQRSFNFDWRLLPRVAAIALLLSRSVLFAQNYETKSFTFQNINLQKGERITGIELHASAGAFKNVENLPVGWSIDIDNDASWQTKLEGTVQLGSASLDSEGLRKLHITLYKYEFMDLKFALSGTIVVTTNFHDQRLIQLDPKNFHIEP